MYSPGVLGGGSGWDLRVHPAAAMALVVPETRKGRGGQCSVVGNSELGTPWLTYSAPSRRSLQNLLGLPAVSAVVHLTVVRRCESQTRRAVRIVHSVDRSVRVRSVPVAC